MTDDGDTVYLPEENDSLEFPEDEEEDETVHKEPTAAEIVQAGVARASLT